VVVISPGGEEAVWTESRHLQAAFCVFSLSVFAIATADAQSTSRSDHSETHSDRIVPDILARDCLEGAATRGFLGGGDGVFSFADPDFVSPDASVVFGQFGHPSERCEHGLAALPAMRPPRSALERPNACSPPSMDLPGIALHAACGDDARSAEAAAGRDTVGDELSLLGKAGARIAQARAETVQILQAENACTAWFRTKEAAPADIFRSLRYSIDRRGPQEISEWETESALFIWHQPYVAHTTQDSGPNTEITINANGAFFRTLGKVKRIPLEGGPLQLGEWRRLSVGPYGGNTLQGQVVTLLHEFGHIIDLLPPDADNLDGKSVRNTDEVLQHCKIEIEARSKDVRQTARK
jgi:hypothetical protein